MEDRNNWFDIIPNEIKVKIAKYLDDDDLIRLKRTYNNWEGVAVEVVKRRIRLALEKPDPEFEDSLIYCLEKGQELEEKTLNISFKFKKPEAPSRRCIIL